MVIIKQRTTTDCAVAVLAMAMNRTYEDIDQLLSEPVKANLSKNLAPALTELGFKAHHIEVFQRRDNTLSRDDIPAILERGPAILSVPSLNQEGGWHVVFWNGEVQDPSTLRVYSEVSQLTDIRTIIRIVSLP